MIFVGYVRRTSFVNNIIVNKIIAHCDTFLRYVCACVPVCGDVIVLCIVSLQTMEWTQQKSAGLKCTYVAMRYAILG